MARSEHYGIERRRTEIYSDFINDFSVNPFTADLGRVTNEQAIKQALKNLVLTNTGERFYNSEKGSKLTNSLFENYETGDFEMLRLQLAHTIHQFEPRVKVEDIRLTAQPDNNSFQVTIVFSIINIVDISELTFTVRRVR